MQEFLEERMKRIQVLSAAAGLLFVATAAHAQRGQDDRHGRQGQHEQAAPQGRQRQDGGEWRGAESQQNRIDRARGDQAREEQSRADQARADQARADQGRADQARAAAEQNQRRAAEQAEQWRDQQNRQAQQREQLERSRRAEQDAQLAEQARRARSNRAFDNDRDDRPGYVYRYHIGGAYRETNQYGVDVLRDALNQGYQLGYRDGLIDRRDGAPADFRRAFDFEGGNYGYTGAYLPPSDYTYYFREGFQRGYDDGYWNRAQYGTFYNGTASILGSIVAGILGLTVIH